MNGTVSKVGAFGLIKHDARDRTLIKPWNDRWTAREKTNVPITPRRKKREEILYLISLGSQLERRNIKIITLSNDRTEGDDSGLLLTVRFRAHGREYGRMRGIERAKDDQSLLESTIDLSYDWKFRRRVPRNFDTRVLRIFYVSKPST